MVVWLKLLKRFLACRCVPFLGTSTKCSIHINLTIDTIYTILDIEM